MLFSFGELATTTVVPYRNPIQPAKLKLPDPSILKYEGGYYLYGTDTQSGQFRSFHSTNLLHWMNTGPVQELIDTDDWSPVSRSNPKVYDRRGAYYLIYNGYSADGQACVCSAIAASPMGDFIDSPANPITPLSWGNCRDASLHTDSEGKHWLIYISDDAFGTSRIVMHAFDRYLKRLTGDAIVLVDADHLDWARPHSTTNGAASQLETPTLLAINGYYVLMYSAGTEDGPCVGYCVSQRLQGPYHDRGVLMHHDGGPASCVIGPDGHSLYVVYRNSNHRNDAEHIHMDRLDIGYEGVMRLDQSSGEERFIRVR